MFGIGHLLRKVQSRQGKADFILGILCTTIRDVIGFEVKPENIKVQGQYIYLNGVNQSLRSEIFMKKSSILNMINKEQDSVVFIDIK